MQSDALSGQGAMHSEEECVLNYSSGVLIMYHLNIYSEEVTDPSSVYMTKYI